MLPWAAEQDCCRFFRFTLSIDTRGVGAAPAADYVASVANHYQDEVIRPWSDVVNDSSTHIRSEDRRRACARPVLVLAGAERTHLN